jgi:hypothetical protein
VRKQQHIAGFETKRMPVAPFQQAISLRHDEELLPAAGSASCGASHCEANRQTAWISGRTRSNGAMALRGSRARGGGACFR